MDIPTFSIDYNTLFVLLLVLLAALSIISLMLIVNIPRKEDIEHHADTNNHYCVKYGCITKTKQLLPRSHCMRCGFKTKHGSKQHDTKIRINHE